MLSCDGVRHAGLQVVCFWTLTGRAVKTNALAVHDWEECEGSDDQKVKASRGCYDFEDYARPVAGGTV